MNSTPIKHVRKLVEVGSPFFSIDGEGKRHYGKVSSFRSDGRFQAEWDAPGNVIQDFTWYDEMTMEIYPVPPFELAPPLPFEGELEELLGELDLPQPPPGPACLVEELPQPCFWDILLEMVLNELEN